MAQNDDERLLALLVPAADATLPPGYRLEKLIHCAIGGPVPEYRTTQRANKVTKVLSPESLKRAREAATIRLPVLDRASPLAEEIFAKHCQEVAAYQAAIKPPSTKGAAAPVESKGLRPPEIRIVRV